MTINLFVRSVDEIPDTPMREAIFAATRVVNAVVDLSREGGLNDAAALVIKTLACDFCGVVTNMYDFVENAAKQSKPTTIDGVNVMYKTVLDNVDKIYELFKKHRGDSDIGYHIQMFNDLMPIFLWVSESDPGNHVEKHSKICVATGNNLLMTTIRNERPELHASYVKTITDFAAKLREYICKNHADGLVWGKGGASMELKHIAQVIPHEDRRKLFDGFKNLVTVTSVNECLKDLNEVIVALDAVVGEQETYLATAKDVLKPADTAKMVESTIAQLNIISDICNANMHHKTLGKHFEVVQQASTIFRWVCVDNPVVYYEENIEIFDVFINRILNEYKLIQSDKGKAHMDWGREIRMALKSLGAIVKSEYETRSVLGSGPTANAPLKGPNGKKVGGPPCGAPPPPPPPPTCTNKLTTRTTCDMSQLFAEIQSQGVGISKILKHVPDCDKLYKQKDREVRTVNVEELQRKKAKKGFKQWAPPVGDFVFRCADDKKWIVEYCGDGDSTDRKEVVIENPNMRHAVFINRCNNCFIKIEGKVNSVQIVESLNVQLQVQDTVGPIELTRSETIEILIMNVCPQVIASKVKGLIIHLSSSTDTEVVTSCTSNVNMTYGVVDNDGNKDTAEVSIPEQFKSHVSKHNKIATEIVIHGD